MDYQLNKIQSLRYFEDMQPKQKGKRTYRPYEFRQRQGGSSTIKPQSIYRYVNRLRLREEPQLVDPVVKFRAEILNDPVLRMNFNQTVLESLPEHVDESTGDKFRLLGNNIEEAMVRVNTAATSAPKFEDSDITGVPIYALFLDYLQTSYGQDFFSQSKVNARLKELFDYYSTNVLKTAKSLQTMNDWLTGPALRYWNPEEYDIDMTAQYYGFTCWEDFFLRHFKAGARPIAGENDDNIITTACESYPLVMPVMPVYDVQAKDEFWLKDNKYSLFDMIDAHESSNLGLMDAFVGGTVYQAFLDPWSYHRWHSPVNGIIRQVYAVEGCYYLQNPGILDPETDDDYINSQPFLSCTSTRQVFVIEADNKDIGNVIVIMIGMCEVSGCVTTMKVGDRVKKGHEIGHFEFGGSSHAIIFEKKCVLDFSKNVDPAYYYDIRTNGWNSRKIPINVQLAKVLNRS